MEYIEAKLFLEQPKEVQKVFLDWWVPEQFDLAIHSITIEYNKPSAIVKKKNDYCIVIAGNDGITITVKNDLIPLFAEGQLRKFIEDKSKEPVYTGTTFRGDRFIETEYEDFTAVRREEIMDENLLMAYWKYACRLVKEGLNDNWWTI